MIEVTMKLHSVNQTEAGQKLRFRADSGKSEEGTAVVSPSTHLEVQVTDPAMFGKFKPGEKYRLNFEKLPEV